MRPKTVWLVFPTSSYQLLRRPPHPLRCGLVVLTFLLGAASAMSAELWWPADGPNVHRTGQWQPARHRYAGEQALATSDDGAALEVAFSGRALVLCLDTLTPPNHYGPPELGRLDVFVDDAPAGTIWPPRDAGEVILHRAAESGHHRLRVVHRKTETGAGCRIRGFRVVDAPTGDIALVVAGEHVGALVDVRAVVSRDGSVVRELLMRNWLSGQCRVAALPPGENYTLTLSAAGWKAWRQDGIAVKEGVQTELAPVYLPRAWDTPVDAFKFPAFGQAAVRRPQESFRARFQARQAEVRGVRVIRRVGPAVISRECRFEDDSAAAYYYHREGSVTLPSDVPTGLYDLEVLIAADGGTRSLVAPRSVRVVAAFPTDPVLVAFGHLDTWGQEQAEYLERIVAISNILAPDMVLVSNEANAAYAAGALHGLEMPFVVNFGNHRGPEPGAWFAHPVGAVDFGESFTVVNFGRAWDASTAEVRELLSAREHFRIRILNAFEPNAPVRDLLDRHRIALIHDAHGPGPTVAEMGATPTLRVGKANSESFRVIRFRDGRPVSATYRGHATAPIPFRRGERPPVRLEHDAPGTAGSTGTFTARWENDLEEAFPAARATFVVPRGKYRVSGGQLETTADSDDGRYTVITARYDLAAKARGVVSARRE